VIPLEAKHPPGPPMTLGNMRQLGAHHLIACRRQREVASRLYLNSAAQTGKQNLLNDYDRWFLE
jgi:hypothetical protein